MKFVDQSERFSIRIANVREEGYTSSLHVSVSQSSTANNQTNSFLLKKVMVSDFKIISQSECTSKVSLIKFCIFGISCHISITTFEFGLPDPVLFVLVNLAIHGLTLGV